MADASLEKPTNDARTEDARPERGEALMRDLCSLRRLASQLRRRAPTADDHMLRAIMGKREALLDSIRASLGPASDDVETPRPASFSEELALTDRQEEVIVETVHEIAALDGEAERILKDRAGELAAEIRKLKAGRKSRESYAKWT